EASEHVSRALGQQLEFEEMRSESLNPGLAALFAWLERVGYGADVAELRRRYPEVGWHTFEEWTTGQDWRRLRERWESPA
ncbi:MAG: NmrA/HSCARG family protein, partial [Actinobacteria bacterium]|nr:NmrA/HSCARG family protein [Actinomycetota bacterium]